MVHYTFFVFIFSLILTSEIFSFEQPCRKNFAFDRHFDQPPAFEKIYVNESQILSSCFGFFLKKRNGELEKVRAILHDSRGMYVIRILTQCPLCGCCYHGKSSPEGTSCPLYDREIMPGYWAPP